MNVSRRYTPKIGLICGSGLDKEEILKESKIVEMVTPYGKHSFMKEGFINGIPCLVVSRHGPKHDVTPSNVNYRANMWALKQKDCTHVIVSSACGSLQEHIQPGDLVLPDSVIDLTRKRESTFYDGKAPFDGTVIHIPCEPLFCGKTKKLAEDVASELGIKAHSSGTAVVIEGPRFSTLAESNLYRSWHADIVNMTLAPEVFLAKELGMCYCAIALITDYDCWKSDVETVNVQNVVAMFGKNVAKVLSIFTSLVVKVAATNWDDVITELQATVQNSIQSEKN